METLKLIDDGRRARCPKCAVDVPLRRVSFKDSEGADWIHLTASCHGETFAVECTPKQAAAFKADEIWRYKLRVLVEGTVPDGVSWEEFRDKQLEPILESKLSTQH